MKNFLVRRKSKVWHRAFNTSARTTTLIVDILFFSRPNLVPSSDYVSVFPDLVEVSFETSMISNGNVHKGQPHSHNPEI